MWVRPGADLSVVLGISTLRFNRACQPPMYCRRPESPLPSSVGVFSVGPCATIGYGSQVATERWGWGFLVTASISEDLFDADWSLARCRRRKPTCALFHLCDCCRYTDVHCGGLSRDIVLSVGLSSACLRQMTARRLLS